MRHIFLAMLMVVGVAYQATAAVPKKDSNAQEKISDSKDAKGELKKIAKSEGKKSKSKKLAKSEGKKSKKGKSKKQIAKSEDDKKWNDSCDDLLDNSVQSTLALEKSLLKKKKKLTQEQFDEKVHEELLVVQLNAWVCAVSSESKKGASVEEQFLQDYSQRVQNRKL